MNPLYSAYRSILRLPSFKGKERVAAVFRSALQPAKQCVDGFWMQLDPVEWMQIELIKGSPAEPKTCALYSKLLSTGGTFIDVGAHVGFHSMTARRLVGKTGLVIAIDPQPYNCDRMLTNFGANGF